jgi:hypothetical protein
MSSNPNSVSNQGEFHARQAGTGASSHHPQAGWDSSQSELKHQPGRNVVPENTVDILPRGTHLPPDRTFLPQNDERRMNVPASTREDGVGTGLTNDQIQDTLGGTTSKDVFSGMGMPGDQSGAHAAALGDGGGRKTGGGLAKYGEGEMLAQDRQKQYDSGTDYVGNSREKKEYRNTSESQGPTKGNRGPSNMTA